jgi:hypothetical protein
MDKNFRCEIESERVRASMARTGFSRGDSQKEWLTGAVSLDPSVLCRRANPGISGTTSCQACDLRFPERYGELSAGFHSSCNQPGAGTEYPKGGTY